jgi:DNA-binding XRE family transcriptional regulator
MTTKAQARKTVTVKGRRFVLVAEVELQRLERLAARAEAAGRAEPAILPDFPPADAAGNRPAVAFARVSIARRIIQERKAAGLSQLDLARLARVRQETICRLESGKHSPTVRTVERIERALVKAARKTKSR